MSKSIKIFKNFIYLKIAKNSATRACSYELVSEMTHVCTYDLAS